jgi:hypothetical protein
VDFAVKDNGGEMIARNRQRRGGRPFIAHWIVDLAGRDRDLVEPAAADRMDLAVHSNHADGAARAAQGGDLPPGVPGRVVFEHAVDGTRMDVRGKTADDIDLAVERRGAGMAQAPRNGRERPPGVGCGL